MAISEPSLSSNNCIYIFSILPEAQQQYEKRATRRKIKQLHTAISEGNKERVLEILNPDVDVNFHYNGESALQIAVCSGNLEICQILIDHGADVDKYNAECNSLLNMLLHFFNQG